MLRGLLPRGDLFKGGIGELEGVIAIVHVGMVVGVGDGDKDVTRVRIDRNALQLRFSQECRET